jgi:hypothetical protein
MANEQMLDGREGDALDFMAFAHHHHRHCGETAFRLDGNVLLVCCSACQGMLTITFDDVEGDDKERLGLVLEYLVLDYLDAVH